MIAHLIPRRFFLTRGVGVHRCRLVSFELALRDAGIPQFNLVAVSSILPPHCEQVTREEGLKSLRAGEIVFCVLARADTDQPGLEMGAGVGLARPTEPGQFGYIAEHHGDGLSERELEQLTEQEAITMLASCMYPSEEAPIQQGTLELQRRPDCVQETLSIAQTAQSADRERWTTVIAAVVFILEQTE